MYDEISLLESDGESEGAWETSSEDEEGEEGCFLGLAPLNLDEAFASEAEEPVASEATASEATASEATASEATASEATASEATASEATASEAETFCAPCGNECAICMDDIGASNCTVTECGHRFHSSCIFRNMIERIECPMCRKDLVDMPEEEDDEEEFDGEDDESESESDGDNESVDEGERDLTCKQMADKLQSLGYTMADVLYYATTYRHSSEAERFNNDLDDRIGGLIDRMLDGELAVDHRDGRTYAQVLANQPPPQVPQQVPQQAPPAQAEPKSPRRRRPEFFEPAPSLEAI